VNRRRLLRFVTIALLAWIAVDLAAIDTCALDFDVCPVVPSSSAQAFRAPAAPAHPHAVLHPDHCFCHGLSIGPDTSAWLFNPLSVATRFADPAPGHLHGVTAVLDHPPKILA
jgi:hypothetical protein